MKSFTIGLALLLLLSSVSFANWEVIESRWRPDANPHADRQVWHGWHWTEGWRYEEQFYPNHFDPSGSAHVIIRNTSDRTQTMELTDINTEPMSAIITSTTHAGSIIWYYNYPTDIPPGGWSECTVRFREYPERPPVLGFEMSDGKRIEVPVLLERPRVRLECVSFSLTLDKMFCYVRSLDGKAVKFSSLRLDGVDMTKSSTWSTVGTDFGLVETQLQPSLVSGSRHLVEIDLRDGTTLAFSGVAWNNYFIIGVWGAVIDPYDTSYPAARKANGINTYMWPGDEPVLHHAGLKYISRIHRPPLPPDRKSRLAYYITDEPDAHDVKLGERLPLMKRLGVHGMEIIMPWIMRKHVEDPLIPLMLLVNGTYKPMEYYVYGQMADIFGNDPYPYLSKEQIELVAHSVDVARDACVPNPMNAVLWANGFIPKDDETMCALAKKNELPRRPPSPKEMKMMIYYALGAGSKGITYFSDHPEAKVTEDGTHASISHNPELWKEVGLIHKDLNILAPYLSKGCPIPFSFEDEDVWARALLCGTDAVVVIVVNKNHYIGYETRTAYEWHEPARNVSFSVPLPRHFRRCTINEVVDAALKPVECEAKKRQLHLTLDQVDTARAFIISNGRK